MDFKKCIFSFLSTAVLLFSTASLNKLSAATAPALGTSQTFAVLGGSAVTNTGPTIIMGDLGVSPGSAVTGFPPGTVTMGTIHAADAVAAQAQLDALTAYNFLAGQPFNTNLSGQDLGGLTLGPGVYRFNSSAQLTGTLTLDAQGNPNAVFIFQIGSTLTTASASSVVVINGGIACNVFFQVGSSATLGTGTAVSGSILANTSITLNTAASVSGRVFALNGAVTLDTNQVSVCTPAAPSGSLQVCKVAGPGVIAGTPFLFSVAGTPLVVAAGPPAAGTCSPLLVEPAGTVAITETIPLGVALTSVTTNPPGALVSSNLAAGMASVTITAGMTTVVTFTDAAVAGTGFLQVCKVAAGGLIVGTPFTFSVAGTPLIVPAGSPPGGTCSPLLVEPTGTVTVNETIPAGVVLTSVSTNPPGALVSSNLLTGMASVTVATGLTTVVTFTDALLANTGSLQVCKVAGPGIVVGTPFTFSVAGSPLIVPAGPPALGTCSPLLSEPAGTVAITEAIPLGVTLTSVTTNPPGALVSSNLLTGMASVTITTGMTTVVTFTDAANLNRGSLQVCKVAGPGVSIGTNFTFSVAGIPLIVAAGPPPVGTCSLLLVEPTGPVPVAEVIPAGVVLTSIATSPPGALVSSNLPTGMATVTVTTGATTIVTFTDAALDLAAQGLYQLRYFANLQIADSYINATNAGTVDGFDPNGRICANFYVFDPREELVSCCACLITPNGLVSLSILNDLTNNTLTGAPLTNGITVKVLANLPSPVGGTTCSPSSPTFANLVPGLKLWAITPHGNTGLVPPPPAKSAFSLTETEFAKAELSANELAKLTGFCRFIQVVASNFGICRSCPTVGAQGAGIK